MTKNSSKIKYLDQQSIIEIVDVINNEDKKIAHAVGLEREYISQAIDAMAKRFQQGGRIIYIGAGSSGRIGALDAIEMTPTYGVPATRIFGILAGGKEAMYDAIEGVEDCETLAIQDLQQVNLQSCDTVIGIAASGQTPYTLRALTYAKEINALSIAVTGERNSKMAAVADIAICPDVGPEIISGSTRMKAGTAQKMVVNMLSTGTMIKVGKTFRDHMVYVQPTNEKLINRSLRMIMELTKTNLEEAKQLLEQSGNNVAVAIVMHEAKSSKEQASLLLSSVEGHVEKAIRRIQNNNGTVGEED